MSEAAAKNDFRSYLKYHFKYHMFYIHACKNDSFIGILENMMRHAIWFRFAYLWHQENFKNAIRVHRKILNLFIEKDANQLETLVKNHILNNLDRYFQFQRLEK